MIVKKLNSGDIIDFKDLLDIFNEVFENNTLLPQDEYLKKLLDNPNFVVIAAEDKKVILGGLTVYILQSYYNEKPVAYIYDVGVKPIYQGKGIGNSLIQFLIAYCKTNGFHEAYVEAETDDVEAVKFYRKTNFSTEMQATHFTYKFSSIDNKS